MIVYIKRKTGTLLIKIKGRWLPCICSGAQRGKNSTGEELISPKIINFHLENSKLPTRGRIIPGPEQGRQRNQTRKEHTEI